MTITLAEAKELTLTRWRAIRKDYKHVSTLYLYSGHPDSAVYGKCGFCTLHYGVCANCQLYYNICSNETSGALYWDIVRHIRNKQPGLYALINKMIKAIKEVKED